LYRQWDWPTLTVHGYDGGWLRQPRNLRATTLAGERRAIYVLRTIQADAHMFFRPPGPLTGLLMDPATGAVLATLTYDGPAGERWEVPIPSEYEVLLLALRER
jgi:hypothetical protein